VLGAGRWALGAGLFIKKVLGFRFQVLGSFKKQQNDKY
jgi:hypothetical protein